MNKINLYTNSNLDLLRERQDPLADKAVEALVGQREWVEQINSWESIPSELPVEFPAALRNFFDFYESIGSTLQVPKLKLAQDFFSKNGVAYLSMLSFYSLPYTYAFANGAQVLASSKRIIDDVGKRLAETGLFLMEVFRPGAFYEDNKVYLTLAKVRLIHAFSRYFIHHFHPNWDSSWGKPVNQEDMLGTNLAFSLLVIRGMRKMGAAVKREEVDAIMAYWERVGYCLGILVDYWPDDAKSSFLLEKTIRDRQMKSSEAGKLLVNSLMGHFTEKLNNPVVVPFLEDVLVYFIGPQAAVALGLKKRPYIPSSVLSLLLQTNSFNLGQSPKTYKQLRYFFEVEGKKQFGVELSLNLPQVPAQTR
ncbi:oxygenase MpaB family protein [Pleomorphovibrio marinus]|uniref:oxygenase MpaB family protein n=1 Tax=Pleomorphovibrio marinus TaxID=2164132 RepID=UPI000E0C859C|nr:oxygenase MpaB family protein [Pleomorphovibrio marinus]